MKEADTLKACLELLHLRRVPAWRSSNHAVRRLDRRTGREFYAFHGARGVSDILAVLPPAGRLCAIECKSPDGKLTDEQQAFLAIVAAAGGVALVVRDVAELAKELDRLLGVP